MSEISRKSSAGNCNSRKKGIGSSAKVSRCKSCSIRLRIKLKVALDTRKVFLNLVSLYVFHTWSNQPLFRCKCRHDRTGAAFSAEMRSIVRTKIRNNHIRLASKRKRIFCCSSTRFFSSLAAILLARSNTAPYLKWIPLIQCYVVPLICELSSTLARRLNQSRASAVLLSNLITIKFGTAETRRLNQALEFLIFKYNTLLVNQKLPKKQTGK